MAENTTLSPDFQITVPEEVRREQRWTVGQEFAFVPAVGGVMLVPVPKLKDLMGILPHADPTNYRDRDDRY